MVFRNVNTRSHRSAPYAHPHMCTHTHTHTHTHTKLRALCLMAETQQHGPSLWQQLQALPSPQDQADGPSSATLSQAGTIGSGPATRYKIKNISNIQ